MTKWEFYKAPEVAAIINVDYTKLDFWARSGLVTPSIAEAEGKGSRRLYTFFDVVTLGVAKTLRDEGFPSERIKRVVESLRQYQHREDQLANKYLVIGPDQVIVAVKPEEAIGLVRSGRPVWGLSLGALIADLRGRATNLKTVRRTSAQEAVV